MLVYPTMEKKFTVAKTTWPPQAHGEKGPP